MRRQVASVLIMVALPIALPMFAVEALASRATAGAISIEAPAGWTRHESGGTTFFRAPGGDARLAVLPPESTDERFDRWFDAAWSSFKREFREPEEVPVDAKSTRAYDHRLVAGSMADADGDFVYVTFWVAQEKGKEKGKEEGKKKGGRLQPVLFVADSAAAYERGSPAVSKALSSIRFVAGAPPAAGSRRPTLAWVAAGGGARNPEGSAASASASASAPPPAPAPTNTTAAAAPTRTGTAQDFVGTWKSGGVSPVGFYDPSTGSWAAPSGAGQSYEIRPDGTFVYAGLLQSSMYNCTTSVFVYRTGTWKLDGGRIVFRGNEGTTRSTDNCNKKFNYERKAPRQTDTYAWRFESDDGRLTLVLTEETIGELHFRRE